MSLKVTGGLAPDIELGPNYILRVTALHPTTGALVAGVIVSDVALQVDSMPPDKEPEKIDLLPPLLTHEPLATIGGVK